ncbi:hypothetical protein HNP87_001793 [Methanococcus maripaludis]|uniref:Uncharacterized protein n=1 Tax=Methanococcus maripaludis TaxID=39152 RepID=A0A7J9NJY6_METMI|nr:hypothetical protein [Methanococcus maripaludis]
MFFENGPKNSVIHVLKNIKHINYYKCVKMVLIAGNSLNNILILKKSYLFPFTDIFKCNANHILFYFFGGDF